MSEFRSAVAAEPIDTPSETSMSIKSDAPVAKSDATPGLYTYKTLKGEPYAVSHFDMRQFWDSPTADMRETIEKLDDWVVEKARERGLKDTPDSYKEIIDGILEQIGHSDNETGIKTFERVNKAVEALSRLEEAKLKPILDVHSMTADEYKETSIAAAYSRTTERQAREIASDTY